MGQKMLISDVAKRSISSYKNKLKNLSMLLSLSFIHLLANFKKTQEQQAQKYQAKVSPFYIYLFN